MSFTWFSNVGPLRTMEQVAAEVHAVSLGRGLDELATVIALMAISTEVGTGVGDNRKWWCPSNNRVPDSLTFSHDSLSDDNRSMGYFQQQPGPNGEPWWGTAEDMMTLSLASDSFLARLSGDYYLAKDNPGLAGQFAQSVQGSAFPDRYARQWDEAWTVLRRVLDIKPASGNGGVPVPTERPDFNEYPNWTSNFNGRGGIAPTTFLLHTQEGDGNADQLSRFLISTETRPAAKGGPVSYHYTVSEDYNDHGVTVVDCVDTDFSAYSVGNFNANSINLCFAGSRASWTRDQWLRQSKAIDVAAYLAVQDCKKYGISTRVVSPPYTSGKPGISDHYYVTKVIGGTDHTDVGAGFPWDVFQQSVDKYSEVESPDVPPVLNPLKPVVVGPADDQLTMKFRMLGNQTLVEAVAEIRDKILGTDDRGKKGVVLG